MLQMVNKKASLFLLLLLLCSCDKVDFKGFIMPTGDVVNSRFEQSFGMHGSKPVACVESNEASYLFYVATDPHISDNTSTLDTFVTALRNDDEASFGVILGDCIDRRGCMPTYLDAINHNADRHKMPTPIFSVIGNHDIYFDMWDEFRELIGPSVYWFEVKYKDGKDLFITLDSASGTLGSKQLKWLRGFLEKERGKYRHCIVLTHTNILYTDNSQISSGNMPMEETMAILELFGEHNVLLCLQGHDHHREDIMFKGVRYTIVGAIRHEFKRPEYLCIRITGNGAEYEWCYIQK